MGLTQSDIEQIAGVGCKLTRAPVTETIVAETFDVLKRVAGIARLRIVYSAVPNQWTEWKSTSDGLEIRRYEEWPPPESRAETVFFDPENKHAGFMSVSKEGARLRSVLDSLAPQVWAALSLRSAMDRTSNASPPEGELLRAALRASDEERRRIARDLHDDLGQSLASLKLGIRWAEDCIRKKAQPDRVIAELSKARQDIEVMLDKTRNLSYTLYPQVLDTLGLAAAVKELADQALRFSQIQVEFRTQGKPTPLAKETEVTLYRCCQEAINNAIRHSEAGKLLISFCFARAEVRVTVEDNGKGFDPRTLYEPKSTGFWTIRQRLAEIGASFRIRTAPGKGTVLELIVPSSRQSDDQR
jgi:signal transduction histidine kinase